MASSSRWYSITCRGRPMFPWPSTGPSDDWLKNNGVRQSEILAWSALYWDGTGNVASASVFTSVVNTSWGITVLDPSILNENNLQAYIVVFRRKGKAYSIWLDGFDEYFLIGRANPVYGKMLPDDSWKDMQCRIADVHKKLLMVFQC